MPLTRRQFLRLTGAGFAVATLPACGDGGSPGAASSSASADARFFAPDEYRLVDAAVARLIPDDTNPDGSFAPGARGARVVDYIDRLLGAFDGEGAPFLFAGGPASDRNRTAADPGCPSTPPSTASGANDFTTPIALSRRQEILWRAKIFGTGALGSEGDFLRINNKAQGIGDARGDVPGLRQLYREGLRKLNATARSTFGADFLALAPLQQDLVLQAEQSFVPTLFEHAVEGMYANPEYGGNQPPDRSRPATGADGDNRPLGWAYIGFEGDRQPLGYTVFDATTGTYCEIAAHPMSTAGLDVEASPLDSVLALVPQLLAALHLRR